MDKSLKTEQTCGYAAPYQGHKIFSESRVDINRVPLMSIDDVYEYKNNREIYYKETFEGISNLPTVSNNYSNFCKDKTMLILLKIVTF